MPIYERLDYEILDYEMLEGSPPSWKSSLYPQPKLSVDHKVPTCGRAF